MKRAKIKWIETITREASLPVEIHDLEGERDIYLKKLGAGIKNKIYFPQGDKHTYFFYKEEWEEFAKRIINKIKNNKNWLKRETDNIYKICSEWLKAFQVISRLDLSKIANSQLYQYYKNYGYGRSKFSFGLYAPLVIEKFLEEETKNVLNEELKSKDKQNLFERYWQVITTKTKLNAVDEERINLLKIAIEYKKKGKIDKEISDLLQKHTRRFYWLPHYALSLPIWSKEYFTKNLKNTHNPERELENTLDKIKQGERTFNKVKEEFKDNKRLVQLINLTQEYLYLRTYRTDILRQAFCHITPFLKELSRRAKLEFNDVLFLTPYEIKAFLLQNIFPDSKEIERRKKHYAIVMRNGIIEVVSDEKELAEIKRELEEKIETEALKGTTA